MLDTLQFFLFSILLVVKEGQLGAPEKDVYENKAYVLLGKVSELLPHSLGCAALGWHQGLEVSEQPGNSRAEKGLELVFPSPPIGTSCLIFLKMFLLERLLFFQCIHAPAYSYTILPNW